MTTTAKLPPAPVIDEIVRLLIEHYVFPETAEQLAGLLQRRLAEGAYGVGDAEELARLVTADLQSLNGDRHLRLQHHADPVSHANWEGSGVQPDVPCAAADSLDRAHALALARLAD